MVDDEIKTELLKIIDKLAELDIRRNEIRQQEYEIRDRINIIRAKNLVEIALDRDDKGKPLYPSEKIREAALVITLNEDSEYQKLRDKLRVFENKLQDISIEYINLSNRKAFLMFEAGLNTSVSPD